MCEVASCITLPTNQKERKTERQRLQGFDELLIEDPEVLLASGAMEAAMAALKMIENEKVELNHQGPCCT